MGCALNTGCGNKFGAGFQNNAFVCRYFPAGNLILNGNSTAPQHGQSAVWAVPQLGSCASSGRTWRLWAARHSQEAAGPLGAQAQP